MSMTPILPASRLTTTTASSNVVSGFMTLRQSFGRAKGSLPTLIGTEWIYFWTSETTFRYSNMLSIQFIAGSLRFVSSRGSNFYNSSSILVFACLDCPRRMSHVDPGSDGPSNSPAIAERFSQTEAYPSSRLHACSYPFTFDFGVPKANVVSAVV